MASADVTLPGTSGKDFEADSTQRTATLQAPGGAVYNPSSTTVWINLDAGTVSTTNGGGSVSLPQGATVALPHTCSSFTFKTAASTAFPTYIRR